MALGDNVEYEAVMVDEFDALNIEVRVSGGPSSSVPGAALSAPRCPGMRALPQKGPVISRPVPAAAAPPTPPLVDSVVIQKETTKYPAKLHAAKVADELKASSGLVFLPGEPSRTYEYSDMGPAFHQRRYFFYLAGVNVPDCAVTYNLADDRLTVWIPYVEPRKVLYNGRVPSIKDVLAASDVDEVRHMQDLPAFLHAYAHQHDKATVYLLDTSQSHPALVDNARVHIDSAALRTAMDEARVTKTAHEIALIRKANAVSSAAHRAVMRHIRRFASERQVAALFTAECTVRGAPTQAYAPIAGSGPNAATLHYGANDEPLAGRHVLVLDAGCEVNCYASDVTRTLPLGPTGHFTPEARQIYDLVERMQEACVAAAPGLLYYSLHLKASAIALRGLLRLGILKGDEKAIWAAGTVAAFFPHGLGHHIGLETHDVTGRDRLLLAAGEREPRAKREGVSAETLVLRPGMVVTVEPGIYFNKDYIEGYFLREDKHRAFIDRDVLARYYPVGGGEDMLRIIRGEAQ
ncbi:Xaa-Pro aminopeptidase PEPP like protein [Verticillium longisporum]|nr:Xaa-Pro aminopeptidase PEPP like protein [Verticillium longisporum]